MNVIDFHVTKILSEKYGKVYELYGMTLEKAQSHPKSLWREYLLSDVENIEGINISCDTVDGVQYLGLSVDTPWYYNEKTRNMGQKKYEAILMKYISCVTDEKLEIKYWAANDDCDW